MPYAQDGQDDISLATIARDAGSPQVEYLSVKSPSENGEEQTALDTPPSINSVLIDGVDGHLKTNETFLQPTKCSQHVRVAAMQQFERLEPMEPEKPISKRLASEQDDELASLEKLIACRKELKSVRLASQKYKQDIAELQDIVDIQKATTQRLERKIERITESEAQQRFEHQKIIEKKDALISHLETKLEEEKDWAKELHEDHELWSNQAADLMDELEQLKLDFEYDIKHDFDSDSEKSEVVPENQNELDMYEAAGRQQFENSIRLNFDQEVNKRLEEIMADDEEVKKAAERVARNIDMNESTRHCLNVQKEINRKLSERLEEEERSVKERQEELVLVRNTQRTLEEQVLELKRENTRLKKEAELGGGEKVLSSKRSAQSI